MIPDVPPPAEGGVVRYPSSHRSKFSRMVLVVKARALSLRPTAPAIECARTIRRQAMSERVDVRNRFRMSRNGSKEGVVGRNVADVRDVHVQTEVTGCESRGAFTPTNNPF